MDRRSTIFVAAAFLPPFVVYCLTSAKTWALDTIYTIDSAEMVLAAWTLGIDHPPGHPLYLMLAHLGSLLPFARPDVGVILVSALTTAAAAAFLALAIRARTGDDLAALATGWAFAFGQVVWFHATIAEVYGVQLAALGAFYALTAAWLRTQRLPVLLALCFVVGLTGATNVLLAVLLVPGFVYTLSGSGALSRCFRSPAVAAAGLAALVTGLSPLLYIPFRLDGGGFVSDFVYLNGFEPGSFRWYVWYLTAEEFTTTKLLGTPLHQYPALIQAYLSTYLDNYSPFLGILSGVGLIAILRDIFQEASAGLGAVLRSTDHPHRNFERTVLIGFLVTAIPVLPYDVADREVFYMPSFAHLLLIAGFGLSRLASAVRNATFPDAAKPWILRGLTGLTPLLLLVSHYRPVASVTSDTTAYDQRHERFLALPDSAIVISTDDGRATRWKYWQDVLGLRPDVRIETMGRLAPRYQARRNDRLATGAANTLAPSLNLADRLRVLQTLRTESPDKPLYTVLDDRLPPELDHFRIRRSTFDPNLLRITDKRPAETSPQPFVSQITSSQDAFGPVDIVGVNITSLDGGISRSFPRPIPVERHVVDGVIQRSEFVDIEVVAKKREPGQFFAEIAFVDRQLRIPSARGFTASRSLEIAPASLDTGTYVRDRITLKIPSYIPNGLHTLAVSLNAVEAATAGSYKGRQVRRMIPVEAERSWVRQTRYQPVARIWIE